MTWLPDATSIVPGLVTSPTVKLPEVSVYRLALSKMIAPIVRAPSTVTVRGAVIFPRNPATPVAPDGTTAGDQFSAEPQIPLTSTFHCGTCAMLSMTVVLAGSSD